MTLLGGLVVDDEGVDEDDVLIDIVGLWVAVTEANAGLVSRKGSIVG
jgi:hypothetical protein